MSEKLGTAQWANSSEINEKFRFKNGDFWLGRSTDDEAIPLGYQDDRHICLVSGSRGGKGTSIIINNLCLYPGSVVVIDPKGENASVTAARRGAGSEYCEGMGQAVYVLDPFNKAQVPDSFRKRFNPLDALHADSDETPDEAGRIANAIVIINRESKEPVWDEQARDLIEGMILHVVTSPDFAEQRSLVTVRNLIMSGDWQAVEMLKELGQENINSAHALLFRQMQNNLAFGGIIQRAGIHFGDMLADAPKQFQGVRQAATSHTKFIDSPGMQRCLEASDFELSELKTKSKGVSLYLSLPQGQMDTHHRWLRMMVSLTITEMEKTGGKLATGHPVLMVLDEFAGLDRMKVIENAAAQIAGFGVKMFFILQTFGHLKDIYKDNWETFLACSGLKIFFNIDDYFSQEYISKLIGDTEILIESQSENVGEVKGETRNDSDGLSYKRKFLFFRGDKRYNDGGGQTISTSTNQTRGTNKTPHKRELIKTNEIGKRFASIKDKYNSEYPGLALVRISGENPFVVRRVNYYEDGFFVGKFDPHPDYDSKVERLRDVEVPVDGFMESGWCFVSCIEWIVPEGQQIKKISLLSDLSILRESVSKGAIFSSLHLKAEFCRSIYIKPIKGLNFQEAFHVLAL